MPTQPDRFKIVKEFTTKSPTFTVARQGDLAYLGAADFSVTTLDLAADKAEPKPRYKHESYVTGVTIAGTVLVSGGYDGKLVWWDIAANKEIRAIESAHAKWIRKVIASPDGKQIASIADDMVCKLWDTATGKLLADLRGHAEQTPQHFATMLYALAWSADGKQLATGDKIGHVRIWDVATGKTTAEYEAPIMYTWDQTQRLHSIGGIRSVAFSPDGSQLAVGGMGKVGNIDHLEGTARIELFDLVAQKKLHEITDIKFKGLVNVLRYSADGTSLLAVGGGNEGFFAFIDPPTKKVLRSEKFGSHQHDCVWQDDTITIVGHSKGAVLKG